MAMFEVILRRKGHVRGEVFQALYRVPAAHALGGARTR